ncbi:hypothetical protein HWV62_43521 [Athelia sp. TMB]|nr:hypothetical protein HWV62_43521 [Athelia sp. TMB]
MQKPLDFASGPLVWIDCEMTGLNPRKDKILEIAVLITNGDLELVDEGIEMAWTNGVQINIDRSMPELSAYQRIRYLLLGKLRTPPEPDYILPVTQEVLKYIQKWIPNHRTGVLAGSSVHADRSFLVEEMPAVTDWLHYRNSSEGGTPMCEFPKTLYGKAITGIPYRLPLIPYTDDSVEVLWATLKARSEVRVRRFLYGMFADGEPIAIQNSNGIVTTSLSNQKLSLRQVLSPRPNQRLKLDCWE